MKLLNDEELLVYFSKFKREIKPKDHSYLFTTYRNCFSGKEAIKILSSLFNLDQKDAIDLGNQMILKGLIVHMIHTSLTLKPKRYEFYHFTNFRRISKRFSILDQYHFASSLDAVYQERMKQSNDLNVDNNNMLMYLDDKLYGDEDTLSPLISSSSPPINNNNSSNISASAIMRKLSIPLALVKNNIMNNNNNNSNSSSSSSDEGLNSPRIQKSPRSNNGDETSPLGPKERSFKLTEYHNPAILLSPRLNSGSVDSNTLSIERKGLNQCKEQKEFNNFMLTIPNVASKTNKKHNRSLSGGSSISPPTNLTNFDIKRNMEDVEVDLDKFETIEDVLRNTKASSMLSQFAQEEVAEENILFWNDLKVYKQETRLSKKLDVSRRIFDTYIDPIGVLALNINKKLIDECRRKHLNGDNNCFDDVKREVKKCLTDLFERLKFLQKQKREAQFKNYSQQSTSEIIT
ncbi:hypothetical protein ABK040_000669 [Willaertia magna]